MNNMNKRQKRAGRSNKRFGCIPPLFFAYHKNPESLFIHCVESSLSSTGEGKSCGHQRGASSEKDGRSKHGTGAPPAEHRESFSASAACWLHGREGERR